MVRNLTLAERVVVRHAFEKACEICKKVIESPDAQLSACIHTCMLA